MKGLFKLLLTGLVLTWGLLGTTAVAQWDQECADLVIAGACVPGIEGVPGRCCFPDGSCEEGQSDGCIFDGGVAFPDLECSGDQAANGIDDACECDDFTTACCLPDETCSQMLPETCESMGGWPNGWCGSSCPQSCPRPECLAAEGDCTEAQSTPGCNDPNLCSCICVLLPHC